MEPAEWVGRDIDGRYRVESVLGVGGMGTVLRAKHAFTGVSVAVKLLRPELQLDPEIQARFLAEAKAPNAIGHPSIVQVLDAGRTADGLLYIVMELLVGRSLRAAQQRCEVSPEVCKRIVLDLLVALGHAHARGFVHRDLKPDNVFLCGPASDVKLLDFGIAKVLDDARKTATGALLGTPAYMAPEQLADASGVDGRADLWAIGVIVYEMMTGRLPFPGRTPNEILAALASAEPTPIRAYLPQVSREVEQFFERALARDPRRRFGAAAELVQALAPLPFSHGSPAAPAATQETAATGASPPVGATVGTMPPPYVQPQTTVLESAAPPGRSRALWIVAAVAVVLIAVGIVVAMSGRSSPVATVVDAREIAPPPDADVWVATADAEQTCASRCAWLANECGTRLAACEQSCVDHPLVFLSCFERSEKSCTDGATCAFEVLCGKVPAGTQTCEQAMQCEFKCNGNPQCVCNCSAKMSPRHTLELARFNACWTRAIAANCLDRVCLGTLCARDAIACESAKL